MYQVSLKKALQRLHRLSGEPSTREISRRTHGALSHTTVSQTLRGEQLPSWRSVELVVTALQGSRDEFRSLWIAAREAEGDRKPLPKGQSGATRQFMPADGELLPPVASAINRARLIKRDHGEEKAISFLEDWQSGKSVSSAVLVELASLVGYKEMEGGRYSGLIDNAIADDYPETAGSALWLAHQCKERQNGDRCLFFLMSALRMAPNSARVLYRVGDYYESDDIEKAAHFFRRACEIEIDSTYLHSVVNVLCMLGQPQEAVRICQEAYVKEKGSDVVYSWAKALLTAGVHDEAVRVLREHADSFPKEREYSLEEIGRLLCQINRLEEAKRVYEEILENDPGPYARGHALTGLAYIHLTQGNEAEGRSLLALVLDGNSDS
ncbi:tetratricopeptide repeat protein [Streptomyces sp. JV185]|uniref:tetratricopeptide repeat protein n=1 Tax=Streptomyces sp. JV185 TaxID=858638 RepID=UPI002E77C28B|nr:tetratricopeptide repeat protein [Streptomyces sp. JV185]MEE1768434.1 tetratricopeptide repeat protein [Streptomyces sp. JV185]